jgi:nicotinamide mononucleotide adenylyltransferase
MSNIDKAAVHLGANALKMIKLILQKHDAAVIEASIEAIQQARKEEREKFAQWMIERSYATGHGDTIEDLLREFESQLHERYQAAMMFHQKEERQACKRIAEKMAKTEANMNKTWRTACMDVANEIEARGNA